MNPDYRLKYPSGDRTFQYVGATVSEGTLDNSELSDRFLSFLKALDPDFEAAEALPEYMYLLSVEDVDTKEDAEMFFDGYVEDVLFGYNKKLVSAAAEEVFGNSYSSDELDDKFYKHLRVLAAEKLPEMYKKLCEAHADKLAQIENGTEEDWKSEFCDELFNLLSAAAPYGCFFGAHADDGALFGFWPIRTTDAETPSFIENLVSERFAASPPLNNDDAEKVTSALLAIGNLNRAVDFAILLANSTDAEMMLALHMLKFVLSQ